MAVRGPSENSEQIVVVRELRNAGIFVAAIPNGGWRGAKGGRSMKATGTLAGMPDLLIFDRPPAAPHKVGVALEMKREGATGSSVRPEQRDALARLAALGWIPMVGFGASDALEQLRKLGFSV